MNEIKSIIDETISSIDKYNEYSKEYKRLIEENNLYFDKKF